MKIKLVNMYDIRYYPDDFSFSKPVGYKRRLRRYSEAVRIVRRLKKSNVNAFYDKLSVNMYVDKQGNYHERKPEIRDEVVEALRLIR